MSRYKAHKKKPLNKLMKPPTPRGLFMQAESFFRSAKLLFHHATQMATFNPPYMFPSIVCEAFSLELYLKCLIVFEGSTYRGTHDLEQLYGLVSVANRAAIEKLAIPHLEQQQKLADAAHELSKQPGPSPTITFQQVLQNSRRAFEALRYVHEKIGLGSGEGWSAGPVVSAVRDRLIELNPEWKNFNFGKETGETA